MSVLEVLEVLQVLEVLEVPVRTSSTDERQRTSTRQRQ